MMFNLENQINNTIKDIEDEDYLLGKMLLQPFRPANSSSRALMDSVHIEHFMVPDKGECPIVNTGYENEFARNSSSFITADANYKVLYKIDKFPFKPNYHYFLIVQNIDTGEYDYIERVCYKYNTESYGYLYKNGIIDMLKPGSVIKKDQVIKTSNGYDEFGNKMNGVNLVTMYLSSDKNKEDSIILSKSAANKLKTNLINVTNIIINDNDIMLNLYGDSNNTYKTFPDVGEPIKNNIFCSIRRLLNENALFSLSQDRLSDIMMSDRNIIMNGIVADIDVYCNNPEALGDSHYNQQLYYYYTEKFNFCKKINDLIAPLAMNGKLSYKLQKLYGDCRDVVNGKQYIKDGKQFNNVTMSITVIEPLEMKTGDKMADRYGGKGIVSYIVDDELMPKLDNGTRVECIKNQSTCINRENVGQLHEQSLTFIGSRIIDYFRFNVLTYKEMAEIWYKFVSMVDKEQADEIKNCINFDDEYETKLFIDSILEEDDAIYLSIRPFRTTINIFTIAEIYKEFPWIKPYTVEVPMEDSNGNIRFVKSNRPMVIGKIYNYRLKQYAEEKFSVTSLSATNLKNLNSKSKDKKNFETKIKKTPIMLGAMECGDLSHLGMEYVVMNLMLYSSSPQARRLFEKLLTTDDPYNIDIKLDDNCSNRNVEIINALLKAIGLKLEFTKLPKKEKQMCLRIMCDVIRNQDFGGYKTNIRNIIGHDDELQMKYNAALMDKKSKQMCGINMCEIIEDQQVKDDEK